MEDVGVDATSGNTGDLPPISTFDYEVIALQNQMALGLRANAETLSHIAKLSSRVAALSGSICTPDPQCSSDDDIICWLQDQFGLVLGELLNTHRVRVLLRRTQDVDAVVSQHRGAEVYKVVPKRADTGRAPYLHVLALRKNSITYKVAEPYMSLKLVRLHRLIVGLAEQNLINGLGTDWMDRLEVHHLTGHILNNHFWNLRTLTKREHLEIHRHLDPAGIGFRRESTIPDWVIERMSQGEGMLRLVVIHESQTLSDPLLTVKGKRYLPVSLGQEADLGAQECQVGPGTPGHRPIMWEHDPLPVPHFLLGNTMDHDVHDRKDHEVVEHGVMEVGGGEVHSRKCSISAIQQVNEFDHASGLSAHRCNLPGMRDFRRLGHTRKRALAMRKVFKALVKLGGRATMGRIDSFISTSTSTTRRALNDLISDGFIQREKHGVYTFVDFISY
jgi:hypothetical protein